MSNCKQINIDNNFKISNNLPITLIAGPCQLESRDHALYMARYIKKIADDNSINMIFKTSFDKANRTSATAKRGIGLDESIPIFEEIKKEFNFVTIMIAAHLQS